MQPVFHVVVNRLEERRVASAEDIDYLCNYLAGLPVFWVHVTGADGERGGALDVVVESNRALVAFLDIGRGIKLASRDETCTQRGIVSFRNDAYPDLELDQIEVHCRDVISPERALSILRHFLITGEAIDLVRWPPDDWDEGGDPSHVDEARRLGEKGQCLPGEEIPF
jgi:hypothetical protein